MGVSHTRRRSWRDPIPTRFALSSKATSPFQGEVKKLRTAVARMERSVIRDQTSRTARTPDFAALHPGYGAASGFSPTAP
ncbi:hypothetical protein J2R76_004810 [Bradyrhizobium sp. USDA 4532]|nr:hypothetical protein [Bradyrhizobium sp. USDA 4545]MCP1921219.1 hypothetical protein [Bradyrhizobium sp. USDA 4532]